MASKNRFFIGTSGWLYKGWYGAFYPADVKKNHLLFFSRHYNSVELNASFYRLPPASSFQKWAKETPADFLFAVKLSRYITHIKRLTDPAEGLRNFLQNAKELKNKFGVLLVQLPPSFKYDLPRLSELLGLIQVIGKEMKMRRVRVAFEPRHKSWFEPRAIEETRKVLREAKAAFVFAESSRFPNYPAEYENVTTDFIYLRFHGPEQFAASEYRKAGLLPWAKKVKAWQKKRPRTVFAYFNNDIHGYAVKDAKVLMELLGAKGPKEL